MSHETYSFGQYTGIVEDNYNQQLTLNLGDKKLIKEVVTSYYEETDSEGKRRINKEKKETKWKIKVFASPSRPKTAPRRPKTTPRSTQDRPRPPQERPRPPQERPKSA